MAPLAFVCHFKPFAMPIRSATVLLVLLLIHARAHAQDTIFSVSGNTIAATVEEIGLKTVRYRTHSGANPVQVTVENEELARIRLQSGQEFVITALSTARVDERLMAHKQCITFDVLAPASNHAAIGYERQIGPRTSFHVKLGYVGLMRVEEYRQLFNSQGGLLKVGLKLRLRSFLGRFSPLVVTGRMMFGCVF